MQISPAALDTITDREYLNNGALQASRVLVELAVCECPFQGGLVPCSMDLSRLMARLLHTIGLGGWSDAIHLDAIPPEVFRYSARRCSSRLDVFQYRCRTLRSGIQLKRCWTPKCLIII